MLIITQNQSYFELFGGIHAKEDKKSQFIKKLGTIFIEFILYIQQGTKKIVYFVRAIYIV